MPYLFWPHNILFIKTWKNNFKLQFSDLKLSTTLLFIKRRWHISHQTFIQDITIYLEPYGYFFMIQNFPLFIYLFICLFIYLFIYLNKTHLNTFKHWLSHRTRGLKTDNTRLFSEFSEYLFFTVYVVFWNVFQ